MPGRPAFRMLAEPPGRQIEKGRHGSTSPSYYDQSVAGLIPIFPSAAEATAAGTTTPTASATAKSGPRPLLLRPGLTDRDRPVQKRCAVKRSNGLVTVLIIGHLDETEAL